ncbi:hypothetical protein [Natronococcus jeotgali]|uniref:hypothetical protein n=1 Tax=Natronococcus jeotgali TaxID=413812 RepID=UPI0012697120|nr:hypothetical protein [Natronococcus jeotgali]
MSVGSPSNAYSSRDRVRPSSDAISYFGRDLVRLRGTVADHRDACRLVHARIADRLETPRE